MSMQIYLAVFIKNELSGISHR